MSGGPPNSGSGELSGQKPESPPLKSSNRCYPHFCRKGQFILLATMLLLGRNVFAAPQITNVKAEPVSPWGKVAIEYTLNEDNPDVKYGLVLTASNRNTKVVYTAQSLSGDLVFTKGTYRVWWDMAADNISLTDANIDFKVALIECVQLWKDGPYWATKNIGATKPEEAGWYFWWGDTVGYKWTGSRFDAVDGSKTGFSFGSGNCPTYGLSTSTLKNNGYITSAGVLADKYDAAKKHWGGNWRLPTKEEIEGLINNCTTTWTTRNGVSGRLVTGKGSYKAKSIFFPAAGTGDGGSSLHDSGSFGCYWSSSPYSDSSRAFYLDFCSSFFKLNNHYRYRGQSVRPVAGFTK